MKRSSVSLSVRLFCPSYRSTAAHRHATGWLLSARPRTGDLDRLLHGAPAAGTLCCVRRVAGAGAQQQRRRSKALSSKSVNTDLFRLDCWSRRQV